MLPKPGTLREAEGGPGPERLRWGGHGGRTAGVAGGGGTRGRDADSPLPEPSPPPTLTRRGRGHGPGSRLRLGLGPVPRRRRWQRRRRRRRGEPPGLDSGDLARAPPWSRAPGRPPRAAPPPPCSPLLSLGTGRWRRPSWLRRTRGGRPRRKQRSAVRRDRRACSAPPLRAHPGQPDERRAPRAKCSRR